jgi:hypothetical protein
MSNSDDTDAPINLMDVRVARAAAAGDKILGVDGDFEWIREIMKTAFMESLALSEKQALGVEQGFRAIARTAHEKGLMEGWERGKRHALKTEASERDPDAGPADPGAR